MGGTNSPNCPAKRLQNGSPSTHLAQWWQTNSKRFYHVVPNVTQPAWSDTKLLWEATLGNRLGGTSLIDDTLEQSLWQTQTSSDRFIYAVFCLSPAKLKVEGLKVCLVGVFGLVLHTWNYSLDMNEWLFRRDTKSLQTLYYVVLKQVIKERFCGIWSSVIVSRLKMKFTMRYRLVPFHS